jgi:hypothetical protein
MNLNLGTEIIIFESILTAFEAISIFKAVAKIGSSLKSNHRRQI